MIEYYVGSGLPMPKRLFNYRMIKYYRTWHEDRLDFIYYTVPAEPVTWEYVFPSEYVGQFAIYDTIKELYSKEKDMTKLLIKDDSIMVSRTGFATSLETVIDRVKKEFRGKHKIPENAIVTFLSPGNEKKEAEFCLDECRLGIEEFTRKFSSPTSLEPRALPSSHFYTILSIQKGSNDLKFF